MIKAVTVWVKTRNQEFRSTMLVEGTYLLRDITVAFQGLQWQDLGSGAEPNIKPRHLDMGCGCFNWHFIHQVKFLLLRSSF